MAEDTGFEPVDAFTSLVFKTSALGRSANLPYAPPDGFEPPTLELTAPCSAVELRGNGLDREI